MSRLGVMLRAAWWGAVVVVLGLGALPAAARADEQPAILKAYGLDWIERVRDDAWPQPKAQRPVICLLDTGVDVTPDTPADDPSGPIVARLALDGGDGLAQDQSWDGQHGTQMASIIAAPRNGYGTVGVFPQARIVSIRVTVKSQPEVYITPGAVVRGVRACARWIAANNVPLAAVVMAESFYAQREDDAGQWVNAGQYAVSLGGPMYAAVGNDVVSPAIPPLGIESVVPVMAGGGSGAPCGFSLLAVAAFALLAPGCEAKPWPEGSSAATAVTGAYAAALVTLTGNSGNKIRAELTGSPLPTAPVRINGEIAGRAFDPLLVSTPQSASVSSAPASIAAAPSTPAGTQSTRLWRPRVTAKWKGGQLHLRRTDRFGGRLMVKVRRGSKRTVLDGGFSRSSRLELGSRPRHVTVWVEARDRSWRSLGANLRVL